MIILGISAIDKESTVSILEENKILYAVSEERLTRVKQQDGFPRAALDEALRVTGLRPQDVTAVGHCFLEAPVELGLMKKALGRNIRYVLGQSDYPLGRRLVHLLNSQRVLRSTTLRRYDEQLRAGLAEYGLQGKLKRFHHQLCHAASAYYTSGWDRTLVISLDGYGSGQGGGVFIGDGGRLKAVVAFDYPHTMGGFYGGITKRLGFILHRHEGKVLGLAAYGDKTKLFASVLRRFDMSDDNVFRFIDTNNVLFDMTVARRFAREDVAAAYQAVLEHVVCHYVRTHVHLSGIDRVCLAGGVAANVKLNQRIMELDEVREVFVHPGMSDVGGALGSSFLYLAQQRGEVAQRELDHVYLSADFDASAQRQAIAQAGLPYVHLPHRAEAQIARLLNEGNVVGRWNGRMEYGPRALGNRSILYHGREPSVNLWLNKRLRRTEFMPFAPSVIGEDADLYFRNVGKARKTAEFMTITFDCTERMKADCPAAVHVDGTARPQLVYERTNPSFYRILIEYKKLSGKSAVINTSFNMHEEPIVYTPADAVRGFIDSGIDYLALGDFVCWQPDRPDKALTGATVDDGARAAEAAKALTG